MIKTFAVKTQKLTPRIYDAAEVFSTTLIIEPDDTVALEKKGTVYAVFDASAHKPLDTMLITKIVYDTLHDAYYQSENASPIQALEKAVYDTHARVSATIADENKVSQLGSNEQAGFGFNILAMVLWGNVLYLVQFGDGGSFLMREETVRPVNSATEGKFTVASGVVKDGDVMIIATQPFVEKFLPADLVSLTKPLSAADLPPGASALVLKFMVDAAFSEAEVVHIETGAPKKSKKRSFPLKLKLRLPGKSRLPVVLLLATIAVVGLLTASIVWTVQRNRETKHKEEVEGIMTAARTVLNKAVAEKNAGNAKLAKEVESAIASLQKEPMKDDAGAKELKTQLDGRLEKILGVESLKPEVFYDLSLVDGGASPTEIVVLSDAVVVVEKTSGRIFVSSLTTPKFEEKSTRFPGIRSLHAASDNLGFADDEGYKIYNVATGKVTEAFTASDLSFAIPYLSFVYDIKGAGVTKYEKSDKILVGSTWAQDPELKDVVSIDAEVNGCPMVEQVFLKVINDLISEFEQKTT